MEGTVREDTTCGSGHARIIRRKPTEDHLRLRQYCSILRHVGLERDLIVGGIGCGALSAS